MSDPSSPGRTGPADHTNLGGRLPLLDPAQLDPGQRALYEAISGGPRAGGAFRITDDEGHLLGPFNALLYSPGIGNAVQALGAALRFEGALPARTRELVICAVAVHWRSDYEWYAHSRVAPAAGLSAEQLEQVGRGDVPSGLAPADAAALRLAYALLRDRAVDAGVYVEAATHHGPSVVVELCLLVGYYQALAGLLTAAAVPSPEADPMPWRDHSATSERGSRGIETAPESG